jgi:hypothetical protein
MARVSKAYAELATSLVKLQGKRSTRHETHVYYYDQRDQRQQTMMGGSHFGGQPQGPTHSKEMIDGGELSGSAICAALPGQSQGLGAAVRFSGSEGQKGLPHAWWGKRVWSALRGV